MKIHIPGQVIDDAAKPIYDALEGPIANQDFMRQKRQWELAKNIARATVTAALEAWPGTGMARTGSARLSNRGVDWAAHTFTENDNASDFPVIIIRTEAEE